MGRYLAFSKEELEMWRDEPEGFVQEEDSDHWEFVLRVCYCFVLKVTWTVFNDFLGEVEMCGEGPDEYGVEQSGGFGAGFDKYVDACYGYALIFLSGLFFVFSGILTADRRLRRGRRQRSEKFAA